MLAAFHGHYLGPGKPPRFLFIIPSITPLWLWSCWTVGTAAGTAKSPSHIHSSPGAIHQEPGPALHIFLPLDLNHAQSIVEEEEGRKAGRKPSACLVQLAAPLPAPGSVGLRAGVLRQSGTCIGLPGEEEEEGHGLWY